MSTRRKAKGSGSGSGSDLGRRGARKGALRKKAPRRQKIAPKKRVRRKLPRRKAAPARKARARTPARRSGGDALAERIVRLTEGNDALPIAELYSADCTSAEPGEDPVVGHDGLREKQKRWRQLQSHSTWRARRIFASKAAIAIEWDAEVHLRDRRVVHLAEVALYEVRAGKIAHERFYYDPSVFSAPGADRDTDSAPFATTPSAPLDPRRLEGELDPLDL